MNVQVVNWLSTFSSIIDYWKKKTRFNKYIIEEESVNSFPYQLYILSIDSAQKPIV